MNLSSRRASRCVLVALVLACALVTPSSADDAVDARFFETRARTAERRGDVRGALQSYLHAQRIVSSPRLIFETARVAALVGKDALAWSFYERYLEVTRDTDEPEAKRTRALAERDRLESRGTFGVIEVTSEPGGAYVYVDRAEHGLVGITPCRVAVDRGTRTLLLERDGFLPTSHAVDVAAASRASVVVALRARMGRLELVAPTGTRLEVRRVTRPDEAVPAPFEADAGTSLELPIGAYDVRLLERPADAPPDTTPDVRRVNVLEGATARVELRPEPPRPATGRLLVRSEPPATLLVDGAERAQTPAALTDLAVGAHDIELVRRGHVRWRRAIRIGEASTTYLDVRLVRE
ncbi:MAG: PEGA domain-containing protein [Myxococcota bacterium]|nr:PEGA domain-containing protein [Myxococcota bacterium]